MAAPSDRFSGRGIVSLYADLAACAAAVMLSGWAYLSLPERDPLRLLLSAPMLLFVPGYLFVEAFRSSRHPFNRRLLSAGLAPGATIALVGILALFTAVLPGGFRADSIVTIITLCCIGLVAAASYHRAGLLITTRRNVAPPGSAEPTRKPMADLPRHHSPVATPRQPPPTRQDQQPNTSPPDLKADPDQAAPASRPQPLLMQTGRL